MPDASVDNQPVTVALGPDESFSPASGLTIVARIQAGDECRIDIQENGTKAADIADGVVPEIASEISVVLTDETTVTENQGESAYISGFVV